MPGFGVVHRGVAHHQTREVGRARLARLDRGHGPAAAHDRDPVRVRQHLAQFVRDQDDAGAAPRERLDRVQQPFRLVVSQYRGRLVEDEKARASQEDLDDLDALLLGNGYAIDPRVRIDLEAEFVGQASDALRYRGDSFAPRRLRVCQHHVLGDGEGVHQLEVLMDHADAQRACMRWPLDTVLRAVDDHAAGVGGGRARRARSSARSCRRRSRREVRGPRPNGHRMPRDPGRRGHRRT